jgi:mevalonate kinase
MIDKASPYFKSENGSNYLARFDALADKVVKGLATDDAATVAAAMLESADMLSEAGVNTTELRDIANRAMSYGAVAAKMTGAGGGGAVLCLIDPRWTPARVEAFEKQFVGLATFALELKGD